jgi:molybdopterin-binding protein
VKAHESPGRSGPARLARDCDGDQEVAPAVGIEPVLDSDVRRLTAVPESMSIREAASVIGISVDTLRRWDRLGKVQSYRTDRNHRRILVSEVVRVSGRAPRHRTGASFSARNRLHGIVRSVEIKGVMALVEIEAGPFLVSAAVTRDAVEDLGLAPGVEAAAVLKATDVMIERGNG